MMSQTDEKIVQLREIFPAYDVNIITCSLQKTNGDVPRAIELLLKQPISKPEPYSIIRVNYLEYWSNQEKDYAVVELNKEEPQFQTTVGRFNSTLPNFRVVKIWRIQNKELWKWYYLKRNQVENENGGDANEKMLFHGTFTTNLDNIAEKGFDSRLSRRGLLGEGIYFAVNADISKSYVKGDNRMFLCRVALGRCTVGNGSLRRPPEYKKGKLYNSVSGHIGNSEIYCIFDNYQSYPELVLEYVPNTSTIGNRTNNNTTGGFTFGSTANNTTGGFTFGGTTNNTTGGFIFGSTTNNTTGGFTFGSTANNTTGFTFGTTSNSNIPFPSV